jgi:hypothetical protein
MANAPYQCVSAKLTVMIRPVEPTVITTSSGEEVFILTLTKSEWEALQGQLMTEQPHRKKLQLPKPVKAVLNPFWCS